MSLTRGVSHFLVLDCHLFLVCVFARFRFSLQPSVFFLGYSFLFLMSQARIFPDHLFMGGSRLNFRIIFFIWTLFCFLRHTDSTHITCMIYFPPSFTFSLPSHPLFVSLPLPTSFSGYRSAFEMALALSRIFFLVVFVSLFLPLLFTVSRYFLLSFAYYSLSYSSFLLLFCYLEKFFFM